MTNEDIATIKGMLKRGDKQQWIAAWFGGEKNSGRISEIHTGQKHNDVSAAPENTLPPPGPYAVSGQATHRAQEALQKARAAIDEALQALSAQGNN